MPKHLLLSLSATGSPCRPSAPTPLTSRAALAAFILTALACGTPRPAAASPPTPARDQSAPTPERARPNDAFPTTVPGEPEERPSAANRGRTPRCTAPAAIDPDGTRWNESKLGENDPRGTWFRISAKLDAPVAVESRLLVAQRAATMAGVCVARVAPKASFETFELRAQLEVGTDGHVLDVAFDSLPSSLNAAEERALSHCVTGAIKKLELGCSEEPFARSVAVTYRVRRERPSTEPSVAEPLPRPSPSADCPSPAQLDTEGTIGDVTVLRSTKGNLPAMRVIAALDAPAAIRPGVLSGSNAASLVALCAADYLPENGEVSLKAMLTADRRGRVQSFTLESETFAIAQESARAIATCARDGFKQLNFGCNRRKLRKVAATYKVTRLPAD